MYVCIYIYIYIYINSYIFSFFIPPLQTFCMAHLNCLIVFPVTVGHVFNVTNEMRVINSNDAGMADHGACMQSTYEELQDTSYQEIFPPYTELVTSKKNKRSDK